MITNQDTSSNLLFFCNSMPTHFAFPIRLLCYMYYIFSPPVGSVIFARELVILLLIVHRKLPIGAKEEEGTARERYVLKAA